jgi:hypothetical protein
MIFWKYSYYNNFVARKTNNNIIKTGYLKYNYRITESYLIFRGPNITTL